MLLPNSDLPGPVTRASALWLMSWVSPVSAPHLAPPTTMNSPPTPTAAPCTSPPSTGGFSLRRKPTNDESKKTSHHRNRSSVDGTKYKDGTWSPQNEKILIAPYEYMHQHPGKDIRRQLIHAFNAWLQVPPESLAIITKVVALLHTSSLL